jgi:hypothetical protein
VNGQLLQRQAHSRPSHRHLHFHSRVNRRFMERGTGGRGVRGDIPVRRRPAIKLPKYEKRKYSLDGERANQHFNEQSQICGALERIDEYLSNFRCRHHNKTTIRGCQTSVKDRSRWRLFLQITAVHNTHTRRRRRRLENMKLRENRRS